MTKLRMVDGQVLTTTAPLDRVFLRLSDAESVPPEWLKLEPSGTMINTAHVVSMEDDTEPEGVPWSKPHTDVTAPDPLQRGSFTAVTHPEHHLVDWRGRAGG